MAVREKKSVEPELREAMECPPEQIVSRVPRASETFLHGILLNPGCNRNHVLRILSRSSLPPQLLRRMVESRRWISHHRIRAAIANHPSTESTVTLGLLGHLLWRDLARVAGNPKINPRIRRKAERILEGRSGELTLGEKVALARIAPRGIIASLRTQEDPKVVNALLDNAQITEDDALAIANRSRKPEILRSVGEHRLWGQRYGVRLALLRNLRLPVHLALRILPELRPADVTKLAKNPQVPRIVRVAARKLISPEEKLECR